METNKSINNKILISFIIPVYNVEKYICRCIDSILKISDINYEIILINDGSTDRSGLICTNYSNNYDRIKVVHVQNGGVSKARNLGLKIAKGMWISFIDSDDWISPNSLSKIFDNTTGVDIIQTGFCVAKDSLIPRQHLPKVTGVFSSNEYNKSKIYHEACWGYIIKKELLKQNSVTFPEYIKYGEDQAFILKALLHSNKIMVSNELFYNYYIRNDSVMNAPYNPSRALDFLKVIEDIIYNASNINTLPRLHKKMFEKFCWGYWYSIFKSNTFKQNYRNNISIYLNCMLNIKSHTNVTLFMRLLSFRYFLTLCYSYINFRDHKFSIKNNL